MKTGKTRRMARGMPCQVRIAGVCNGDPETVVLAHYRLAGTCGYGMKPDDEQGAWACSSCHDVCDERTKAPKGYTREEIRLAHAEGCFRTQYIIRHKTY